MPNTPVLSLREVPKIRIGGMNIAVLDRAQAASQMVELAQTKMPGVPPFYLTSANGQVLSLVSSDAAIRALFETADLVHADGQPLVMASRLFCRRPLPERLATTDLIHDVAPLAAARGASFYMFGAQEEINRRACENLQRLYPSLNIAGRRNGYYQPEEESAVLEAINIAQPDILWVSLGVPREQEFVVRNRDRLKGVGLIKTSGGMLDFLAGARSRAPLLMQRAGLEWLYRMMLEPRRLGPRYIVTNVHAAVLLLTRTGDA